MPRPNDGPPPSPERSAVMASIRSFDTKPEMLVRRTLHGLGYRYVLHDKRLPGRPDLTFPSRRAVIFVNGCFWHRHPGCRRATTPKTRAAFWRSKFDRNARRDRDNAAALAALHWSVLVVWECELRSGRWTDRAVSFLDSCH